MVNTATRKAKFNARDPVKANDKAPGDYEGREGTVLSHRAETSEYEVQFDNDPRGPGWLYSWWLDRLSPQG